MTIFGKRDRVGQNVDPEDQWKRIEQEREGRRRFAPGFGIRWRKILGVPIPVGFHVAIGKAGSIPVAHKKTPSPRLPRTKHYNDDTGQWEDLE